MYSRRDFGKLALAGLPLSVALGAKVESTVSGVRIGATTFSLRELPRTPGKDAVDDVVRALTPRWCRITADFAVRGGIGISVDVEFRR